MGRTIIARLDMAERERERERYEPFMLHEREMKGGEMVDMVEGEGGGISFPLLALSPSLPSAPFFLFELPPPLPFW